jgi:hypothetical protein
MAQLYSIPDTNIHITKSTDFVSLHAYAEIENLTNDTMAIRWRCRFEHGLPSEWDVSLDDQTTYFNPLTPGDSSMVILDTGLTFPRKLIIGIDHNHVTGYGMVTLTVFPLRSPADSARVHFLVTVTPGTAVASTTPDPLQVTLQDNLLEVHIRRIPATARVWSADGRLLDQFRITSEAFTASAVEWPKGILFLELSDPLAAYCVELHHF